MSVLKFIAHEIKRFDPKQTAELHARPSLCEVDDNTHMLLGELKRAFNNRTSKRYGQFNPDIGNNPMPAWIKDYMSDGMPFETFTQKASEHFLAVLDGSECMFEGHIIFCEEELLDAHWLYVFHLQHKSALLINNNLDIIETEYADATHLGFGARINLSQWKEGTSDKFLSISRARGDKDLEDLFIQFIGFADTIDVPKETNNFLEVVDEYAKQFDDEKGKEYRAKVVDYCLEQDKAGEPVVYKELSSHVNEENPEGFEQFVRSQQEVTDETLILDRGKLRKYSRISGRTKDLALSFSASLMGSDVLYNPQTETLTLKNLPKSLLRQLKSMN